MEDIEMVALVLVLIVAIVVASWAWRRQQAARRIYQKHVERAMR